MTSSLIDEDEKRLRKILQSLNDTETPIDIFYDQMEKEFGDEVPFSKLKTNLENFYITISKSKFIPF